MSRDLASSPTETSPEVTGTLAGATLRPPSCTWNGISYDGSRVLSINQDAIDGLEGNPQLFHSGNFIGVTALTNDDALRALEALQVKWTETDIQLPSLSSINASKNKRRPMRKSYRWPSNRPIIGVRNSDDICAYAEVEWNGDEAIFRTNALDPGVCVAGLANMFGIPEENFVVIQDKVNLECVTLDIAADAAILAKASGRAVKVNATTCLNGSATDYIAVEATVYTNRRGQPASLQLLGTETATARPALATLLMGREWNPAESGLYKFPIRHVVPKATQLVSPSVSEQVASAAYAFARECSLDEWAVEHQVDPIELRLQLVSTSPGENMVRELSRRAGWSSRRIGQSHNGVGRGFAYSSFADTSMSPPRRCWAAWVVDVRVDNESGKVDITRLVVGHHIDQLGIHDGSEQQLQHQMQLACKELASRAPEFDNWSAPFPVVRGSTQTVDVGGLSAEVISKVEDVRDDLSISPAVTAPAAAAIANAIFDATGVRLREPSFGGRRLSEEIAAFERRNSFIKRSALWVGGVATAVVGFVVLGLPWRSTVPAVNSPVDTSVYSATTIERGRLVAAAGDCVVCHTSPGGTPNVGGLGLETPFGIVYSTNITPDIKTGIGSWSYIAFERAMREGIHRDGRRLYPAFPYTAFAKFSDGDIQSVYAYLMSQAAVTAKPPETHLAFPYNVRLLLAGWNALFHDATPYKQDLLQTAEWNRGAYLVQGAGHCGACHTPRNALGAERSSASSFLAGGGADGWIAPALNGLSKSPKPWALGDFYDYLRYGYSPNHGVAAGPMGPVVKSLADLPDSDISAMALYLSSLNRESPKRQDEVKSNATYSKRTDLLPEKGEKLFAGACASCHDTVSGPKLFGVRPPLALNTNLYLPKPDNLINIVLHGIQDPAYDNLGAMPGFAASFNDAQIADLLVYMRARFAPDEPEWHNAVDRVGALRKSQ